VYNRVAANLRSHQSNTVGMIITEMTNPFFSEVMIGVHSYMEQSGFSVLVGTTFDSREKQAKLIDNMLEQRAGGVILCPVTGCLWEDVVRLKEWGIPTVMVSKEPADGVGEFDYVSIDNEYGAYLAVRHLVTRGHREIAMLGGYHSSSPWQLRAAGYYQAMKEAGLPIDESLFLESPASWEGGMTAAQQLIQSGRQPTAIFCFNDVVAMGVLMVLRQAGIRPGRDVAVVGFDDIPAAAILQPSLTTVAAFPREIGTRAAQLLQERLRGSDQPPRRVILTPELRIRESCQCIRVKSHS
ncbi:MAG: LacI family DNA-binding transcriptional regulator, partial [Alicyclobacillus sp.]|nr:LacI family DNA-binding transcriptional regulator [Alicyclobacillus sp.]